MAEPTGYLRCPTCGALREVQLKEKEGWEWTGIEWINTEDDDGAEWTIASIQPLPGPVGEGATVDSVDS